MLLRQVVVAAVVMAAVTFRAPGGFAQSDAGIVRGRVMDTRGVPVADFPVRVIDAGGRDIPLLTGRDGRFETIGLEPGAVTVGLDAQGYAQIAVRCRLPAGQTAFIELFASRRTEKSALPARCRIEPPTSDLYIVD